MDKQAKTVQASDYDLALMEGFKWKLVAIGFEAALTATIGALTGPFLQGRRDRHALEMIAMLCGVDPESKIAGKYILAIIERAGIEVPEEPTEPEQTPAQATEKESNGG